jgi:Flp pilus assembly protein TadD
MGVPRGEATLVSLRSGFLVIAGLTFLVAGAADAQTVRGQIFMPDGSPPRFPITFYLTSTDGLVTNEVRFTDSNGRFILERLNGQVEWIITVESDRQTYEKTEYRFLPSTQAPVRFFLKELPRKEPEKSVIAASPKPRPPALIAYEAAMKKIQEDKLEEAEKLLHEAVAANPELPEAHIALGALRIQQKKLGEAEKHLRRGLELDPKSAFGQMNLGIVMDRTDRFAEAIPPLREAIRLNRDLTSPHLYLGVALVETDQFEEAERELNEAASVTGLEEILRHLYLGQLYARTGRYEKSIPAFETYLQKAPKAPNAAEVRALIDRMKQALASKK